LRGERRSKSRRSKRSKRRRKSRKRGESKYRRRKRRRENPPQCRSHLAALVAPLRGVPHRARR
jgi:hypothetical protein